MKFIFTAILVVMLSGCSSLFNRDRSAPLKSCLYPGLPETASSCNLMPWLDYWLQVNTLQWQQRKKLLSRLSGAPADRVKMILLSHVPNTPYQSRLRAQLVSQLFIETNPGKLAQFIQLIVFLPAQEKLELESALTTQTQFNINQERQLQLQRGKLAEQELQISQLLQIEKNIVEKPTEAKP